MKIKYMQIVLKRFQFYQHNNVLLFKPACLAGGITPYVVTSGVIGTYLWLYTKRATRMFDSQLCRRHLSAFSKA